MEQIIQSLSTKLNLPESVVRSGLGIILNFLKQKAAGSQFEALLNHLPGADTVMGSAPTQGTEAQGLLGGLLEKAGGLLGGNFGEAAGAIGALQQAGIPLEKAAPLAKGFFEQAKAIVNPEVIDALLAQVPALKSLLNGEKA